MGKIKYVSTEAKPKAPRPYEVKGPNLQEPITGTMVALDSFEEDAAEEVAEALTRQFVTGGYYHPTTGEWEKTPMAPPEVNDKKLKLNAKSLSLIARISAMHEHSPAESRLTVEDIIELVARDSVAWAKLQHEAALTQSEGEPGKG